MNNKGFMLAEVIVVSSIIVTVLVVMYAGLNRLFIKYNERTKYYSIDAIYAAKNIEDYLIDSYQMKSVVTSTNNINDLIPSDFFGDQISKDQPQTYVIQKVYFIKLNSLPPSDGSDFSNYITYLKNNITDSNDKALIVTEITENNSSYFGNVVVE